MVRTFVAVLVYAFASAGLAMAQDAPAAVVSGGVSASNMQSHTDLSWSGAFGYRFNHFVGMEIEATFVPNVRSAFPTDRAVIQTAGSTTVVGAGSAASIVQIFPTPRYSNPGGRIVLFTNSARVDIPTTTDRVAPFFIAGGGVASVRRTAQFAYPILDPLPLGVPTRDAAPTFRQVVQSVQSSSTDLALTLGGGVTVWITDSFGIEADLRLFRLFGDEDRNLGRFGAGVRYLF